MTDLQRGVLSDGKITDAEFREVRQRYIDCLTDAGIHATARPDGGYDFDTQLVGAQADAERQCAEETTYVIEPLYYAIRTNPQKEDFSALVAECLRTEEVVDSTFTKDDWDQFVNAFSAAQAGESNGNDIPLASELPKLPGGVAMDDPRVQECSTNPLGR
ncbi:hypothetical protein ET475_00535 [Microbacterium protaetiae]|uniref:Uncharacterized protein n=1 Tax=Microbacterium protaetiae TaxID=2509458 RepID=A0A4P6EEY2_9MICO|nr:hypothetical protein [Microbacterium protaetiae]QAY58637.1 hypothetical protein ET475_00535 [Microbacterium protaetiae]